jgi:hypothetical protein
MRLRSRSRSLLGALVSLAIAACPGNDEVPPPTIASITPDRARPGTPVVVAGKSFCQQPASEDDAARDPLACRMMGTVRFGVDDGHIDHYTDESITVTVPELPRGEVSVHVVVGGRISNSVDFFIY